MPFTFKKLDIPGLILITPKLFPDSRGHFAELFVEEDFEKAGIKRNFERDASSLSRKGVVRGLHYQLNPYAQAKLIRSGSGKLFVVAVDIRKSSPSFGKWAAEILSRENKNMLWIPEGFAAGAMALEDDSEMVYKISGKYSPEHARGIKWDDNEVGIKWPVEARPIISDKDISNPRLREAEMNFE